MNGKESKDIKIIGQKKIKVSVNHLSKNFMRDIEIKVYNINNNED